MKDSTTMNISEMILKMWTSLYRLIVNSRLLQSVSLFSRLTHFYRLGIFRACWLISEDSMNFDTYQTKTLRMNKPVPNTSSKCKWISAHDRCCFRGKLIISESRMQQYSNEDEVHFTVSVWGNSVIIINSMAWKQWRISLTVLLSSINLSNVTVSG
jgi:hypothetical protein